MVEHRGYVLLWKGVVGIAHEQTRFPHRAVSHHDALQHDSAAPVRHDSDLSSSIVAAAAPPPCCPERVLFALLLGGDLRTARITSVSGGLRGALSRIAAASLAPPPPTPTHPPPHPHTSPPPPPLHPSLPFTPKFGLEGVAFSSS